MSLCMVVAVINATRFLGFLGIRIRIVDFFIFIDFSLVELL